jgi:hypothetical protein
MFNSSEPFQIDEDFEKQCIDAIAQTKSEMEFIDQEGHFVFQLKTAKNKKEKMAYSFGFQSIEGESLGKWTFRSFKYSSEDEKKNRMQLGMFSKFMSDLGLIQEDRQFFYGQEKTDEFLKAFFVDREIKIECDLVASGKFLNMENIKLLDVF